ncbi:MAG: hypothetical protein ABI923_10755 [bacterium]
MRTRPRDCKDTLGLVESPELDTAVNAGVREMRRIGIPINQ